MQPACFCTLSLGVGMSMLPRGGGCWCRRSGGGTSAGTRLERDQQSSSVFWLGSARFADWSVAAVSVEAAASVAASAETLSVSLGAASFAEVSSEAVCDSLVVVSTRPQLTP